MSTPADDLRLWLATSGWGGPFQFEEVIVAAGDIDGARRAAEEAFGAVVQPVCRARMRIADLGPVAAGVVAGPRRGGEPYTAAFREVDARCGEEPAA